MQVSLGRLDYPTGDLLDVEIVERKGLGHPDTICDETAEKPSLALSRRYLAECGGVLHHNVDKALLVGGAVRVEFGGGQILNPMELFLAGRAATSVNEKELEMDEIARDVVRKWFARNIPTIDLQRHLVVHSLVRPGSAEFGELFGRRSAEGRLANDTSCGAGYAPLSRLEGIVYAVEHALCAAAEAELHPEIGKDIKVMGVRRGKRIELTVACAIIGRFVDSLSSYLQAKSAIAEIARQTAARYGAKSVAIEVNKATTSPSPASTLQSQVCRPKAAMTARRAVAIESMD
jgi:S-adenosylmethionine synthetase